jgi:hypothetical protein
MQSYQIDATTCLPTFTSEVTDFHSQSHEFFLWHDPANANRVLVYMTNWTGGLPDPEHPGLTVPDLIALAVTDERPAPSCRKPKMLAGFTLQDVGGPRSTSALTPRALLRRPIPRLQRLEEPSRSGW